MNGFASGPSDHLIAKHQIKNLPTAPGIISKFFRMIENINVSTKKISYLNTQDQVFSDKILRIPNNTFCSVSRKISFIAQALMIMKFNVLKSLILTKSVFNIIQESIAELWKYSIGCATETMATTMYRYNTKEILIPRLLHDLNKVILTLNMPEDLQLIRGKVEADELFFYVAKILVLDFNNGEIGQWLAEYWNLSKNLNESIRSHYSPERVVFFPKSIIIAHVTNVIVRSWGFSYDGNSLVPHISQAAWKLLSLKISNFTYITNILNPKLANLNELTRMGGT
ncbi:MAG: HDOD domain-containing protein [Candidatus Adiutrix intracellularis]|nr:HDOD domain-containing protein [Candidatus Adiutrix intracellularis]